MRFFFKCIFVSFHCCEAGVSVSLEALIIVSLLHQPVTIQTNSYFFFWFLWFSFSLLKDHAFDRFSGQTEVDLLEESEAKRLEKPRMAAALQVDLGSKC